MAPDLCQSKLTAVEISLSKRLWYGNGKAIASAKNYPAELFWVANGLVLPISICLETEYSPVHCDKTADKIVCILNVWGTTTSAAESV